MSATNMAGSKVHLHVDPEAFRHELEENWADNDDYRWKQLAILNLVGAGWKVQNIARAFNLNKNHVHRVIANARTHIGKFANNSPARAA
ncbi:hypothetical protein [Rubinisphaera sp.]|uniref:hypothetical protein n=1 Tax=Rubinisphaera sp. TaxID=2024857 RepID=UPI000C0EE790|nr:hypothetical protein [Rubinisphaera sp.]MBV07666.1 hypothetical protein [Rubinisphaera sp.]HCS53271.1 hypothetical protein [Planctomycetaceae bacterium]|tara:strand:+ start:1392 stop:1658 length:267 start_codon:yes stop_codon:yes gene_type:complete